ncbi:GNAT family N-acetyltransferase [Jeotgalibacillus sp. R-1-5s-1]|uniref:GNAT family N-acetyltransferase n=1 Tax=Jeotgalibacillus sp. R-1-5s-1 TaxID=2555897 RepID=UPI00141B3828|nr:GNAT family N-acetyltransferase [Jeotgalibacillus sp. R-1-5s-1]
MLKKITELKTLCEQTDGVQLKLNEDTIQSGEGVKMFYHFKGDELIAYLGVYYFGSVGEVCGMVHPDYRRQGLFSALFKEACDAVPDMGIKTMLLNTPAQSESGQAFVKSVKATYKMTEYQMKWEPQIIPAASEAVSIRQAEEKDRQFQIKLDAKGFSVPVEDAEQFLNAERNDPSTITYIIEWNGVPAGKIRIHSNDDQKWIYGFVVSSDLRGKGIGRNALLLVLNQLQQENAEVHLEVEAENKGPLKLYESCGFKVYHAQDYFNFPLS